MSTEGKKVMLLGGNYFQMTATKAAKELGCYVISVDYLPDNPAHKYADAYYNISTTDREAVLALAQKLHIDGIVSYASDVSAPTAAYIAQQMGLVGNPLRTVMIMTDKKRFHPYLKERGFFVPETAAVKTVQELEQFYEQIGAPVIVKPAHSSGSKGISVVRTRKEIPSAFAKALAYARGEALAAEQFVQRKGRQIAGDAFVADGKIVYFGLANEHFDRSCNPLVPIGESFPADLSADMRIQAEKEIQRALTELGYQNGAVNLDFMFLENGDIFIIELGPRNGGNLITDAIEAAAGVNLADYTIKSALGEDLRDLKETNMSRFISSYIWHSHTDGIYDGICISDQLRRKILRSDIFAERGNRIHRFDHGGFGIGAALLAFDSMDEMLYMMDHMEQFYEVKLRKTDG